MLLPHCKRWFVQFINHATTANTAAPMAIQPHTGMPPEACESVGSAMGCVGRATSPCPGFFVGHSRGKVALHFIVKTFEKIFCHGFSSPVDEPLAELRDLAAHGGMHRNATRKAAGQTRQQAAGSLHLAVPLPKPATPPEPSNAMV